MSVEHASQEHPPELQPQPTTILLNFGSFTAQETFGNVQRHWTSLVAQMVKGFPCNSDGKESTCNVKDLGSIPGLGRSTGGEHGHPLHYFCLENLHGQRSLVGHSPWGRKESDMTERLSTAQHSLMHKVIWSTLSYEDKLKGCKTIKSSSLKESKS